MIVKDKDLSGGTTRASAGHGASVERKEEEEGLENSRPTRSK